jgi:hypothetical protein
MPALSIKTVEFERPQGVWAPVVQPMLGRACR